MLAKEEAQSDEIQWIQPSMDERGDSDNDQNAGAYGRKENRRPLLQQSSLDAIKTGATRIMNPKDKKHMETCLVETDNSEGLQTILSATLDDEDEQNWIQPGTTAEEDEPNEVPHTSILQDFKDTIAETWHHLHLPHHTNTDGGIKDKHGLLETAMETMLIEQANIMGASGQPVAPVEPVENVKFAEKRNASIESFKKLLVSPFRRRSSASSNDVKKFSLFDSAMKTMLNETAHIIEGVGVHPKSLDETDETAEQTEIENADQKLERDSADASKSDSHEPNLAQNTAKYSKFCDNLVMSHVLTNAESQTCTAGNSSQLSSVKPTHILTKRTSKHYNNRSPAKEIDSHTNIDAKSQSCDNSSGRLLLTDNTKKPMPHTKISMTIPNTNHNPNPINSPSKSLIQCPFVDLINQTNKTKLLALDPHSKHSLHDEKHAPSGKSHGANAKTHSSPTKVPTSSSAYNTSSSSAQATNLSSSKSKDSKDAKETICRRSSDSDLSVTPKGNHHFYRFNLFGIFFFLMRHQKYRECERKRT